MEFSEKLQVEIKKIFENDPELRDSLLAGNPDAIRKVGAMSQIRIRPEYIAEMCENGKIEELYEKAKLMIQLRELYETLCYEYSNLMSEKYTNGNSRESTDKICR